MLYNVNMKNKVTCIIFGILIVILAGCFWVYNSKQATTAEQNICMDDELIADLIVKNINPFSKIKFIKKRNTDCKVLLITNKEEAEKSQKADFCPVVDASTASLTMLIYMYVDEMYDRESAAKELKNMLPLMLPYEYCPQFYPNIETLIKIKKRLGLL